MSQALTIEQIDKNYVVDRNTSDPDLRFHDIRKAPFQIYGLYRPQQGEVFTRMPDDIAAQVSKGVDRLHRNTAGARVRFSTDSAYMVIRAEVDQIDRVSQMPVCAAAGFDLYLDSPDGRDSFYRHTFAPPYGVSDTYVARVNFAGRNHRCFTLCFPYFCNVKSLYIGIQEDATLKEGAPYRDALPVVYYGSSITHGSNTSRTGNTYQNIVCRNTGWDFINLGFSGCAKAEDKMIEYLASLAMSAFVCDYDHNAPSNAHLKQTLPTLYRAVRATHPDIPFLFLSRPDHWYFTRGQEGSILRRQIIHDVFYEAYQTDKNVYFIDGESYFNGYYGDACTTDNCHPNDLGAQKMAEVIGTTLRRAYWNNTLFG